MPRLDFADDIDEEPTAPGHGVVVTVAALVRAIDSLREDGKATREAFSTGMQRLGKRIDRVVVALCIMSGSLALVGLLYAYINRGQG